MLCVEYLITCYYLYWSLYCLKVLTPFGLWNILKFCAAKHLVLGLFLGGIYKFLFFIKIVEICLLHVLGLIYFAL